MMFGFFYLSVKKFKILCDSECQITVCVDSICLWQRGNIWSVMKDKKEEKIYFFSREEKRKLKSYNRGRKC